MEAEAKPGRCLASVDILWCRFCSVGGCNVGYEKGVGRGGVGNEWRLFWRRSGGERSV